MNILGSERIVTQDFLTHGSIGEDYAGIHLSHVKIFGKGIVTKVINKFKPHEDAINYNEFLSNQSIWRDGNYYNCISITGKKIRVRADELGGNEIWIEGYYNNERRYLRCNHLGEVLVNVGDIIDSNTIIGKQGNTGLVLSNKPKTDASYGSHIHFEVRNENNININPREYAIGDTIVNHIEQGNCLDCEKMQIKVLVNKINIRESYTTNSKDIGDVYKEEVYTVLDKIVDDTYTWYKITTNQNVTGYVASLNNGNWIKELNSYKPIEKVCDVEEKENPRFVFECPKDDLYAIRLNKGEKIYLL